MLGQKSPLQTVGKVVIYACLIFLAILSIFPFWIMIMNGTRSNAQIQEHCVSLLPSTHFIRNFDVFTKKKDFNPLLGFRNSMIVSVFSTILTVYFATLTAYSIVIYRWKMRRVFFTFIIAVMLIPPQVVSIGFYQMILKMGLKDSFLPLILPSIAAPSTVFFMKQYMEPSLSYEIIQSARIDGAKEFYIFNKIALPIMKPAIATQAIFAFVSSWNNLFMPLIVLSDAKKKTMPIMVSLLKGNIYKQEWGAVYLGLTLSALPLFIVYFALSKYIIAGVALGSVKG